MAFYRTYIADILGALSPQDLAWGVQSVLAGLMSPCISDQYEGNWVYFADTNTQLLPNETLVYFMPPGVSIIKNSPKVIGTVDLTVAGNTNPKCGASEVYVQFADKTLLANLAFHELMHNILQLGNAMHKDDGLRTGRDITTATPLTNQNKRDMAGSIYNSVPQWLDGISILANGNHDPISEYFQG